MTSLIHDAICQGDLVLVKSILDAGADIEQLNDNGDTPLISCCMYSPSIEFLSLFIKQGANVNVVNANGESILSIAIRNNIDYLVDMLLLHNVEVNTVSAIGETPLFLAIYKNKIKLAKELLLRNADPSIDPINPEDGTTLLWAAGTGDMELVKSLVNQGSEINAPGVVHSAIAHIPVLKYLISKGIEVNRKGPWGSTALHMAAYKCIEEAVDVLLSNGADILIVDDRNGKTPYQWYLDGGYSNEKIKVLLES